MESVSRQARMMGTIIDVTLTATRGEELLNEVFKRLRIYEKRFSANDPSSELMAVNHQAGRQALAVAPDLYQLIALGKQHSLPADSNLNIAIGPLVQTWRIGFSDARVPAPSEIAACLEKIDPEKIILNDATHEVLLKEPGMLIDLGALAKGFIGDLIVDYLKEQQVTSALINLGGNVIVLGDGPHPDGQWRIGIRNPQGNQESYRTLLKVRNQSVVTSGIYERALQKDGQTYHHIFNQHTGYPVATDLASLTIVSDLSVDGEIWTTRLFGKEPAEILATVEALPGIEALLLTQTGAMQATSGLHAQLN